MSKLEAQSWTLLVTILGTVTSIFLILVYGYAALFPKIEASSPTHFERNVVSALAAGDVEKALKIARRATQVYMPNLLADKVPDPMTYTVFARALIEAGREEEALRQLDAAVSIQKVPLPPFDETRKPFYFAPARLTLGDYLLQRDRVVEATDNFELARAYASSTDYTYRDYASHVYQAYSKQGLWGRALEYGEPTAEDIDRLPLNDIECIARICEGRQNWRLAQQLAERLIKRSDSVTESRYLLGRIAVTKGEFAEAATHLIQASASGHPYAAFFLGVALEKSDKAIESVQAYLSVPASDPYRAFALAKVLNLQTGTVANDQDPAVAIDPDVLGQIDQLIAAMRLNGSSIASDKYTRFKPISYTIPPGCASSGACFPVLVLWEDAKEPAKAPSPVVLSTSGENGSVLFLRRGNIVLQLQWAENLVNWAMIDHLPTGNGPIPGWIDTARDWFHLRSDFATTIQNEEEGGASLGITKLTWLYGVPIPAHDDIGYLLLGRMKGMQGMGGIAWQSIANSERVIAEQTLPGDINPTEWTWQAGYVQSQYMWNSIRVQLSVQPHIGTISFDDVMLLELAKPSSAS